MYPLIVGVLLDGIGDILVQINDFISGVVTFLLRMMQNLITTTPYPKTSSGEPLIVGEPTGGGVWPGLYDLYQTSSDLTIAILFILLVTMAGLRIYDAVLPNWTGGGKLGQIVKAMIATEIWWYIAVAMLAFSDLLAKSVMALSGEGDITGMVKAFQSIKNNAGFQNSAANGIEGIAMSFALLVPFVLQLGIMLVLLILWVLRYIIIFLLMPVMPLAFALWAFEMPGAESLSRIGTKMIKSFVSLVFLSFPAAVVVVVFGEMASNILDAFRTVMAGTGASSPSSASSAMALADGAAATAASGSLIASLATLLLGIVFMTAIPLVAAGGPFLLMKGGRNDGMMDIAKSTPMGQAYDKIGSTNKSVQSYAQSYRNASGQTGQGSASSGGSSNTEKSPPASNSGGSKTDSSASSNAESDDSRFGRLRQRMSSSMETAKELKEMSDAERAKYMTTSASSRGKNAAALLAQKSKSVGDVAFETGAMAREHGISETAALRKEQALEKSKNALSKGKFKTGEGMENLSRSGVDMSDAARRNLRNTRSKLNRAIKDKGHADKRFEEVRDEKVPERITADKLLKNKVEDEDFISRNEELNQEMETLLKSVGGWEEYQESGGGMKAARQIAKNNAGEDFKAHHLDEQTAEMLGIEEEYYNEMNKQTEVLSESESYESPDSNQINSIEDAINKYGESEIHSMIEHHSDYTENEFREFIENEMVNKTRRRDLKETDGTENTRGGMQDRLSFTLDDVERTETQLKGEEAGEMIEERQREAKRLESDIEKAGMGQTQQSTPEESNQFSEDNKQLVGEQDSMEAATRHIFDQESNSEDMEAATETIFEDKEKQKSEQ